MIVVYVCLFFLENEFKKWLENLQKNELPTSLNRFNAIIKPVETIRIRESDIFKRLLNLSKYVMIFSIHYPSYIIRRVHAYAKYIPNGRERQKLSYLYYENKTYTLKFQYNLIKCTKPWAI